MQLDYSTPLPDNYRAQDFLDFHARDRQSPSENVAAQSICKAIIYQQVPALLKLEFRPGLLQAKLMPDCNDDKAFCTSGFRHWITRITGLDQDITRFEQAHQAHPHLGPIIRQQQGLRFVPAATAFEAVSWAILGQQISVAAAVGLRRKLVQLADLPHSSGLLCYPDAPRVARLTIEQLRGIGLSGNKAHALHSLSQKVCQGEISLEPVQSATQASSLEQQLLSIKGIGPWTVNYSLMRGCGWMDGSVHGDAAIQRYLARLLHKDKTGTRETREWLAQFSPWRSLAAAHLWLSTGLHAQPLIQA